MLGLFIALNRDQIDFLKKTRTSDHQLMLKQIPERHGSSCIWVSEDPCYTDWKENHNTRLLWLHGAPGSGKTVTTKYLISHIQAYIGQKWYERHSTQSYVDHCVAYFFCNEKIPNRSTSADLIRCLLYQILCRQEYYRLFQYLDSEDLKIFGKNSNFAELLWGCLFKITQKSRGVLFWIFIDAIDELKVGDQSEVLEKIQCLSLEIL
jgi:hypothetical protein